MQQGEHIYRLALELSHLDRESHQSLQLTLVQHPSETGEHVAGRLLAYLLWYEPELAFSRGICHGEEPDIWSHRQDGHVRTWIEVGLPNARRIRRARRMAEQVCVLIYGPASWQWEQLQLPRLADIDQLHVLAMAGDCVREVATCLQGRVSGAVTVSEGRVYLDLNGRTTECEAEPVWPETMSNS